MSVSVDRRVSVVVPSYNRAVYLHVLLTSLTWSRVSPDEFEVIVVNDGGTDDLAGLVDRWRLRGLDLRLVTLRTDGPPRNNARARNAGVAAARYPVVLQTDPDIVFVDDVLSTVREAVDTGSLCSCDSYIPLTRETTELRIFRPGADLTPDLFRQAAVGRPNMVHSPDGVGGLHGAFASNTRVLRELGGYDESFEYWGWEDRELLVTAAARGLRRRRLSGTMVVHLWHPVQRGDLGREVLAQRGQISRAAWDVQMQRAGAEVPRAARVRPAPRADAAPVVAFDATAFDRWRTATDNDAFALACRRLAAGDVEFAREALPGAFQLAFDALCGEGEVLAGMGDHAVACSALELALTRPWEPAVPRATSDTSGRDSALGLYAHLAVAFERLAVAEWARGRRRHVACALRSLEAVEGGPVRAAALRLRLALAGGRRRAARRHLATLDRHRHTAEHEALALECLLLDGQHEAASARLPEVIARARDDDHFSRLRAGAYARLLDRVELLPVDDPATSDRSEFLFSVAVRAERAGLDLAAWQLYRTFLESGGPTEPRLRVEAATRSAEVLARVARVAAPAVVDGLCGAAPLAVAQAR